MLLVDVIDYRHYPIAVVVNRDLHGPGGPGPRFSSGKRAGPGHFLIFVRPAHATSRLLLMLGLYWTTVFLRLKLVLKQCNINPRTAGQILYNVNSGGGVALPLTSIPDQLDTRIRCLHPPHFRIRAFQCCHHREKSGVSFYRKSKMAAIKT